MRKEWLDACLRAHAYVDEAAYCVRGNPNFLKKQKIHITEAALGELHSNHNQRADIQLLLQVGRARNSTR